VNRIARRLVTNVSIGECVGVGEGEKLGRGVEGVFFPRLLYYLLLTAIWLMPGGSVYKDKVHEHPQYNTVPMSTIQIHEHYKTQETENT
jgi:hypothetical protein